MPRKMCARHQSDYPCSCGMGNLYRFVEPLVLFLLHQRGRCCGYDLYDDIQKQALTDATIEKAALYRTLRQLELNGKVKSVWEKSAAGPARRVYKLTRDGEKHLEEWAAVMENLSKSMNRFVRGARKSLSSKPSPACKTA